MFLALILGQIISISCAFTGIFTTFLNKTGVRVPISQAFSNYLLLALIFGRNGVKTVRNSAKTAEIGEISTEIGENSVENGENSTENAENSTENGGKTAETEGNSPVSGDIPAENGDLLVEMPSEMGDFSPLLGVCGRFLRVFYGFGGIFLSF
jgi:hypothetical protein